MGVQDAQAFARKVQYQADTAVYVVKLGDSYKHHPLHIPHASTNYSQHVLVHC